MSFILAIGIYQKSTEGFIKKTSAPSDTALSLFSTNYLKDFEEKSLPDLTNKIDEVLPNTMGFTDLPQKHIHFYVKKAQRDATKLIVICTRSAAGNIELSRLFTNIETINTHGNEVKQTLDDVVNDPNQFIGPDVLLSNILGKVQEIKEVTKQNITKALGRGETIDIMAIKAEELADHADQFKNKAKKMNSCCR